MNSEWPVSEEEETLAFVNSNGQVRPRADSYNDKVLVVNNGTAELYDWTAARADLSE